MRKELVGKNIGDMDLEELCEVYAELSNKLKAHEMMMILKEEREQWENELNKLKIEANMVGKWIISKVMYQNGWNTTNDDNWKWYK